MASGAEEVRSSGESWEWNVGQAQKRVFKRWERHGLYRIRFAGGEGLKMGEEGTTGPWN